LAWAENPDPFNWHPSVGMTAMEAGESLCVRGFKEGHKQKQTKINKQRLLRLMSACLLACLFDCSFVCFFVCLFA
jgi:hypothetical protein